MKKLMFSLALVGISAVAFAQQGNNVMVEESTEVMTIPTDPYKVETNTFFSNWFFSFGAGGQVLFGHDNNEGKFTDRMTPSFNVAIGKWFTPGLGLRIQYNGFNLKGFSDGNSPYIQGSKLPEGYYKQKFNYMNLHGDVLFNPIAMFGGYNEARVYEVLPYAGLGWAHSFDWAQKQYFAANFGIINRFRISRAWDVNLELSAMLVQNQFDTKKSVSGADAVLGASVGFTYKFSPRGFKPAVDVNAILALTSAQMDAINAALADQMMQNKKLKQQLANQPQPVIAEQVVLTQVETAPQSVFFEIGSSVMPAKDEINLKAIADQLNNNPEMNVILTGYADSGTGTPEWNKKLSADRAQTVANALIKLGVNSNRIQAAGDGGVTTLIPPSFNRRVVIVVQ